MAGSERKRELGRRRHRKQQVAKIKKRAEKASASERQVLCEKLRKLTPGAEVLIDTLGLAK